MMLRLIGGGIAAVAAPMGSVLVRAAAPPCPLALDVRRTNLVVMTVPPMGNEAECATKRSDGMDGKSPCLYEAGIEPLGRSVRWMQTGGERAAPERYWCGAMQAAKMPGLAEGSQGEYTK
jgi:hypothetical protein